MGKKALNRLIWQEVSMGWFDFLKSDKKVYEEGLDELATGAFPNGNEQVKEETMHLFVQLHGALDKDETMKLLVAVKTLWIVTKDRSEKRFIDYILRTTENKLKHNEAKIVYKFLTDMRTTGS
ncbi:hypothetical protein HOB87_13735 [Candidatus Woesearchaeota archaeon]|nr:hypothetical protein [Candidatus Woesearchaeota archaeon]